MFSKRQSTILNATYSKVLVCPELPGRLQRENSELMQLEDPRRDVQRYQGFHEALSPKP